MKYLIFLLLSSLSLKSFAAGVVFEHLPIQMIAGLQLNLDSIYLNTNSKETTIKKLYHRKLINHYLVDDERKDFESYYALYEKYWHFVDLNQDGTLELLFQGKYEKNDDRAYTEIYTLHQNEYTLNYLEIGALLGYKINPNSKEIILYTHEYPCCESYTHNISTIRFINGKIKARKKFFIARDKGDMKGNFFPEKLNFQKAYNLLPKTSTIYWSTNPINEEAFKGTVRRLKSNIICRFPKNTVYRILAESNNAYYVLITGHPIPEKDLPINVANLKMVPIYAWIQKNSL